MHHTSLVKVLACASLLAALSVVASCGADSSSSPSAPGPTTADPSTTSTSASPAQSSDPFTSAEYAYTVGLPAGWTSVAAGKKWDGKSGLSSDSPEVDQFVSPAAASAWGVAGRWDRDLTAYATFLIRWTERFHGDTCPSKPQTRSRITIGGQPGVLLEYDCGILINVAATVYGGVGYHFGFRDPAVHAASDPADHADFLHILQSAQFPE